MKNALYEEMYKEYQKGFSLDLVGRMFGMTRQSVYIGFKRRGYKLRGNKPPLPFLTFNGNKYTLRNNGYYGKTYGSRSLMHRDVWEYHNGEIPPDHDIHHKDRDKTNNTIENLELLLKSEHARRYSTGNNQYGKSNRQT